jgi:hypothetical protein
MDTKTLITNLHSLFCNEIKGKKKYTKVWLSEPEAGGLYNTGKYVMNVMAEHEIETCNGEIRYILGILNEKAKAELQDILRVVVYHTEHGDDYYCRSEDLMVFEGQKSCTDR